MGKQLDMIILHAADGIYVHIHRLFPLAMTNNYKGNDNIV